MVFRKSIIILLLVCITVSFNACGVGDYEYIISNGFRIVRVNSERIVLSAEKCIYEFTTKNGNKGLTSCAVENYINEFCYNEQYIAVKQFDPEKLDFENFESNDFSNPAYYLVDAVSTNIYGPYKSQEEFDFACKELNVVGLGEWISTRSNPKK
ncbi:MAG: DUF3997 domain-containing protein [Ruminococcaceae bacterium]|nr:DUF3997 domain-containing protein [Oscillospiraceae bacterium]